MMDDNLLRAYFSLLDPSVDETRRVAFHGALQGARRECVDEWIELVRLVAGLSSRCLSQEHFNPAQRKLAAALILEHEMSSSRKMGLVVALVLCAHMVGRDDDAHPFVQIPDAAKQRVRSDLNQRVVDDARIWKDVYSGIQATAQGSTQAERRRSATVAANRAKTARRRVARTRELLKVERYVADLPKGQTTVERALALSVELVRELETLPPANDDLDRWLRLGLDGRSGMTIPISALAGTLDVPIRLMDVLPTYTSAMAGSESSIPLESFVRVALGEAIAIAALERSRS